MNNQELGEEDRDNGEIERKNQRRYEIAISTINKLEEQS